MKRLLPLLLAVSLPAYSAVPRLSECGSLPSAVSEASPLDLDQCPINEGDEILSLLKDVQAKWGGVYVRAPSKTVSVTSTGTYEWPASTRFVLLEDEEPRNKFTISHIPTTTDAKMWRFINAQHVRIGGANLSVTFVGTHPGLGTAKPCSGTRESCDVYSQFGLLEFALTNGTNPDLVDVRANFKKTWSAGMYFWGSDNGHDGELKANRWKQLRVAGTFLGSSVVVNSGVMDVWLDPDRTVFQDPWVRGSGWDGGVALKDTDGTPVGCYDKARSMFRNAVGAELQFTRRVTGGVTSEYGFPIFNLFLPKFIGDGPANPYVVRLKDWGHSGPEEVTGYPSGVMVKHSLAGGPMKHDPAPAYNFTDTSSRNIRFVQLPGNYGMGQYGRTVASGCAPGNATSNNFGSGYPFIWRAEASNDGLGEKGAVYVTAYINVEFAGFTPWKGAGDAATYIQAATAQDYFPPNQPSPDRIHNITLRAASGTRMPGSVQILDTSTITGPGSWYNPRLLTSIIDQGSDDPLHPINNTIRDTRIHGWITVGSNATNTVIANVDFIGDAARTILTTDSPVKMSNICARAGSTITGAGSVEYEGTRWSLPYTIPVSMMECSIKEEPAPSPPRDVIVE